MDLHFTTDRATPSERDAIDRALGANAASRDRLLPVLHAISEREGWISNGALNYACERLGVPPAEAYGVASFYAMFATKPRPKAVLHLCDDVACRTAGAEAIAQELQRTCGPAGSNCAGGRATWLRSPCLGLCERAPAALFTEAGVQPVHVQRAPISRDEALASVRDAAAPPADAPATRPHTGGSELRLLRRIAAGVDPCDIGAYRANGGFKALSKARAIGPRATVAEIVASNLLGRGGAAFPAGKKMEAVASASARPHFVVCNADESEPGTFKDRILMEWDPFAVVEAMAIAALAVDGERGYIYVRGEYPLATARLQGAIDAARADGVLEAFEIEIRRGAGAYICGEETALFNSIEGKRGEPRSKPPFPVNVGLFGKPTLVNNVETLCNLPSILLEGGAAYAARGTAQSAGTRLFCLSGAIERPGLYEVPHGTALGDLIELGGGVRAGARLRAVLLGGAAGSFVGPGALALPLSFEDARSNGATLGSGVVMLFDERTDMAALLLRVARFFREESCGQCVPCRVGTVRQEEALERILSHGSADDVALLNEIGRAMRDASICGLGQTAANAILSAQSLLPEVFAR